eukprot:CAMPEP_0181327198 /NCGR_PEP_ID=MMETSP1101-20121128/21954_1 /TAXON_ID=46948 /ORGANISM="Rhodomonas abbreviata, Strain Caron Lab Isolate" /LENGTH=189 /DNA_ID=CAMNT_0023435803 /DNA_START=78 /DNA_END=647 /DNA_ORIENTATION=+
MRLLPLLLVVCMVQNAASFSLMHSGVIGKMSAVRDLPLRSSGSAHRAPSVAAAGLKMEFMGFKFDSLKNFGNMIVQCRASHILVTGPSCVSDCEEVKKMVMNSIDFPAGVGLEDAFAKVAAQVSECPSSKDGGSLGTFGPGRMVAEFDQACFNGPIGNVIGPVKTKFGAHLIFVHERSGDAPAKKSGCG